MNVEQEIIKLVNKSNYQKGKLINSNNILPQKQMTLMGNDKIQTFYVKSSNNENVYLVQIITKNRRIISTHCTCPMCDATDSCKHIAAVLINKKDEFFSSIPKEEIFLDASDAIIDALYKKNNPQEKIILKLEIELKFENSYYNKGVFVNIKIGENKLYSLNNKMSQFFNFYDTQDDGYMTFGKEFIYNPSKQTFTKEDNDILKFIKRKYETIQNYYYDSRIFFEDEELLDFMKLLKNKEFHVFPMGIYKGYQDDNPFECKIIKNDKLYEFNIKRDGVLKYLDASNNFLIKDNKIYKISEDMKMLLSLLKKYNTDTITFDKKSLPKFTKAMNNILKEKIDIEEAIKDEFVVITPKVELYFDFDEDIFCNIKFIYNQKEVYYNSDDNTFLRNDLFEKNVALELLQYGIANRDNRLVLNDLDDYECLIDDVIPKLSLKYDIFTTEKLDKANLIKRPKITSHFSIGGDNVFKYDFNLDGINPDEFKDIFENMKLNKKYYKLKNGKLLSLEEESLNEFKNLTENMDIDAKNISDKECIIPKYKALYLDSLKKGYKIIKTNNLFDEFIDNFNKYKKANLDLETSVLRNYQLVGVKWLYNIYKCNFGGILADEMGLGKSIQVIYLIKQILKEKCDSKILIVAPTSLIYNWENEFKKFGSEIEFKVFAGIKKTRKDLFKNTKTNVFITTYGLIREDREEYLNMDFDLTVIDEAQNIKNPNAEMTKVCKQIKSNVKLALTGTPIENSVIELWSIFDFLMPGYLGSLKSFQEKYNIKDTQKQDLYILDTLNKQITPFILRRKKVDVLKDLPEKIENNVFLELNEDQKKIYALEVKRTQKEMDEIIATEGFLKARFKILTLITKLRQICIDPKIVFEDYKGSSIKMDEVCNTVHKLTIENHKILIFTSYRTALELLKNRLEKEKIKCYVIDGSVSSRKRNELVNSFNVDDTNVFLIMLKAGGTGLNLVGADTVIHLDLWWNPQAENQATDRAHRIGQKNKVQVIKFICKGTIEERILELQNKKKILSDTLIEGENRDENIISSLNEKDFRKLLEFSND